jgi:alanine racemase
VPTSIDRRLSAAGLPPLPRTAWLEIDLGRLVDNLAAIRRAVPEGVRVEPVVKADAYGHGMVPVALALADAGAEGLCVATLDEGVALRDAGVELPILVLYPAPPVVARDAARRRLTLTAGDADLLARTLEAVRGRGDAIDVPLDLQIEVETGLGRGGLAPAEVEAAAAAITSAPGARLVGLWSHLAAPEDEERTTEQDRRFHAVAELLAGGGVRLPRHVAASGGILAGSVAPLEAVRPGLALYGLIPEGLSMPPGIASVATDLRPVMSIHARPVRVADLPTGSGVGYGPSFVTARPSRIATLPIGYGDGWARAWSNRADALVRGRRVPLVGTVAMDAVMVDVTDVPGPAVGVDDEFVLLGEQGDERILAGDLARSRTTISWEVVTAMARRLPRVYDAPAGAIGLRTLTFERYGWPRASSSGTVTSATSRSTPS